MKALLTALALCLPSPALALSCMPYDAVLAYHDAAKSDDSYVVVLGDLTFDDGKLPVTDWEHQQDTPPDTLFQGTLTGHSLTHDGFTAPFDRTIRINVQCFGPWCSSLTPDIDYLTFLKQTDSGYLLEVNPCGGFAFGTPSQQVTDQIAACFRGERCVSPLSQR